MHNSCALLIPTYCRAWLTLALRSRILPQFIKRQMKYSVKSLFSI